MAVDVNTAKADLVPVSTLDNLIRLKEHMDRFPTGVKSTLEKNIPEADMSAVELVWAFLDQQKHMNDMSADNSPRPENPEPHQLGLEDKTEGEDDN